MTERNASDGWERWPVRKTLDGVTYLCRWCAKPLSGQATAYCYPECSHEIYSRCMFAALRVRLFEERGGKCETCGIDINQLQEFFRWWRKLINRFKWAQYGSKEWECSRDWPVEHELRAAMGYKGQNDLWECNHKLALAEGGNPVDPENLEILCLKCHRKHTAALRKRLKEKKSEGTVPILRGELEPDAVSGN